MGFAAKYRYLRIDLPIVCKTVPYVRCLMIAICSL